MRGQVARWHKTRRILTVASWVVALTMMAGGWWAFAVGDSFVGVWWVSTGIMTLPGGRR